jgi:hypothetical protein
MGAMLNPKSKSKSVSSEEDTPKGSGGYWSSGRNLGKEKHSLSVRSPEVGTQNRVELNFITGFKGWF